jgi:predicted dienelactone hydrolase
MTASVFRALAAVLLAPALAAAAPLEPAAFARAGPHPVGVRTIVLVDSSRDDPHAGGPRTLVTDVWYPASEETRGKPATTFVEFFGARPDAAESFVKHFGGTIDEVNRRFTTIAVRGAAPAGGRFPVLVFSHGNGGLRHQNVFQLDHLASHGYIVATPDHTGNAGVTVIGEKVLPYDRQGRSRSALDRPRDVSFILDRLVAEGRDSASWLGGRIDEGAVGLLGHSFGGYTVTKAAEEDARVKAVLPMTVAFSKASSLPTLLMLGELDRTVKEAGNGLARAYFVSLTGPKHLLVLRRGGHFSFSDMDRINPDFGDGIGTERKGGKETVFCPSALTKEIINAYTLAFFEHYLRGDARSGEFLRANHYADEVELQPVRRTRL